MARRMTDAQAADLYRWMVALPLVVVLVAGFALIVLHVVALHGRRILPERPARVVGWLVFGLAVGLSTQLMANQPPIWIGVIAIGVWILAWALREWRLGDAGWALIGAGLPWLVVVGTFMVLLRADPLIRVLDIRFVIVVAALLIVGAGVMLVIAAPRAARPVRDRASTLPQRAMLLPKAIEREQAMGPVPAAPVLAVLTGVAGSTTFLLLGSGLEPIVRDAFSGAVFLGLSLGVLWVATPRRVVDAHWVMRWLVDTERRMWAVQFGRPMPRVILGLRRLLDSVPDSAAGRPLRIEVLATLGRIDEARDELLRLPLETAEGRAAEAELAAYIAWCEAKTDEAAIQRWADQLPAIDDSATRLRLTVSLAVSRARHASLTGDPAAVDHLLAVRHLVGPVRSRFSDPVTIGIVIGILIMGAFLVLGRSIAELVLGVG